MTRHGNPPGIPPRPAGPSVQGPRYFTSFRWLSWPWPTSVAGCELPNRQKTIRRFGVFFCLWARFLYNQAVQFLSWEVELEHLSSRGWLRDGPATPAVSDRRIAARAAVIWSRSDGYTVSRIGRCMAAA